MERESDQMQSGNETAEPGNVIPDEQELLRILRSTFGHHNFKNDQLEVITVTLRKRDCLAIFPTGFGKSLCFQLAAMVDTGVTIVVEPTISLIVDQLSHVKTFNMNAAHLASEHDGLDNPRILRDLLSGQPSIKLLYLTPEKLIKLTESQSFLDKLHENGQLSRIVVDEVYCLLDWGAGFRIAYEKLICVRRKYTDVPFLALTATATPGMRNEIVDRLGLIDPIIFASSNNRPNLSYEVIQKDSQFEQHIIKLLKTELKDRSGIIYCAYIKDCKTIFQTLTAAGIGVVMYHSNLTRKDRDDNQAKWSADKVKVCVATNAFGLGINKRNVRFVIHASIPKSTECYLQETGRAGRDCLPSSCIIYCDLMEMSKHRYLYYNSSKDTKNFAYKNQKEFEEKSKIYFEECEKKLLTMARYCNNRMKCRKIMLKEMMGESIVGSADSNCDCDNCRLKTNYIRVNATEAASLIITLLDIYVNTHNRKLTLKMLSNIYRGNDLPDPADDRVKLIGKGSDWNIDETNWLISVLVADEYLAEEMQTVGKNSFSYLMITHKGHDFITSRTKHKLCTVDVDKDYYYRRFKELLENTSHILRTYLVNAAVEVHRKSNPLLKSRQSQKNPHSVNRPADMRVLDRLDPPRPCLHHKEESPENEKAVSLIRPGVDAMYLNKFDRLLQKQLLDRHWPVNEILKQEVLNEIPSCRPICREDLSVAFEDSVQVVDDKLLESVLQLTRKACFAALCRVFEAEDESHLFNVKSF